MSTAATVILIIVIAVALVAVWLIVQTGSHAELASPSATSTTAGAPNPGTASSSAPAGFSQSISDGTITISYPSSDFGLATNPTQILVHSYIPPCDQGFDYCLYYLGSAFQGTNFESAGIRIQKRTDLTDENSCLTTPPQGYTTAPSSTTSSGAAYAASRFSVGGAAAGHFSLGTLYRIFYRPANACYEFETRVGETQFANYPSGTIRQFTSNDLGAIQSELGQLLGTLKLANGESVNLP